MSPTILPVIFHERPEFLHRVELPGLVILQCLGLEVLVDLGPELLLKAVAEVAEQEFQTVSKRKRESEIKV